MKKGDLVMVRELPRIMKVGLAPKLYRDNNDNIGLVVGDGTRCLPDPPTVRVFLHSELHEFQPWLLKVIG